MKRNIYLYFIAIGGLLASGCGKGYLTKLAVNPNTPSTSQTSPELVLSAALTSTAAEANTGDYQAQANWFGLINWKGGYAISTPTLTYVLTNNTDNGNWNTLYYNLSNYVFMETAAKADTTPTVTYDYFVAISKIMQAWDYEYLVDNFDNVPYTQAFQASSGGTILPGYDSAQSVYDAQILEIDTAISIINANLSNATEFSPGVYDVMFGGNMSLWASFANTLKLRMLLQQSEMPGRASYITGEIAVTATTPYLAPGQNGFVNPGYANQNGPNGGNQQNPFYGYIGFSVTGQPTGTYAELGAGQPAIDFFTRTHDSTRLPLMFTPVPDTTIFVSAPFGILPAYSISNVGPGALQGATQPAILISAGESLLLQAEAAERGWIPGGDAGAKVFYDEGVTESFLYLSGAYYNNAGAATAATAAANAYLAQTGVQDVSWTGTTDQKIRTITEQKWIAWDMFNPMISWNDYRRFQDMTNADGTKGWPDVPLSKNPNLQVSHIPYRVLYPQSEYNLNAANVAKQGTLTGDNTIFWMP